MNKVGKAHLNSPSPSILRGLNTLRAAAIPQSGNILYCGVCILPGEQPGEYEDEKLGILDVLIRFRDGSRMNLEMQMMAYGYWKERVLFYLCRIYTGQLKKGESYGKLKKCVHVSVLALTSFRRMRPVSGYST